MPNKLYELSFNVKFPLSWLQELGKGTVFAGFILENGYKRYKNASFAAITQQDSCHYQKKLYLCIL